MAPEPRLSTQPEAIRAVPRRRWGQWLTGAVAVLLAAWLVAAAARSHFLDVGDVGHYLFNPLILRGVRNTIELTLLAQVAGTAIGMLIAVVRLSRNPVTGALASLYVWLFRGTPVLVQLLFWFNAVPSVFKRITIAVPFTHVVLWSTPMVAFMTPLMAAFLGLGLNEGAYMAEIVRAGILSVDRGQTDAAQALGMTRALTMRRIVLPQAMRVIIPPTGNELVSMLKTSSLATVVTFGELLRHAGDIYSTNLKVMPLLVVASIWYLALTSVAGVGQHFVERRFSRGYA